MSKFSAAGRGLPHHLSQYNLQTLQLSISIYIYIYIYTHHSVSLGTDPPSKLQPSNFFCPPRQTKSLDNSSMLLIFNNKTYTDFRTAYKHVLIPSWFI